MANEEIVAAARKAHKLAYEQYALPPYGADKVSIEAVLNRQFAEVVAAVGREVAGRIDITPEGLTTDPNWSRIIAELIRELTAAS